MSEKTWQESIVLPDGRAVEVRPIREDDEERLVAFHGTLSEESIYRRFFGVHPSLSAPEVLRFTHVDGRRRAALVALDGERIVAVGRYDRLGQHPEAEVAFVVTDAYQGRGIATALLRSLARIARRYGIGTFVADTLFDNRQMRSVFTGAGYRPESELNGGVVHVSFRIDGPLARSGVADGRRRPARCRPRTLMRADPASRTV